MYIYISIYTEDEWCITPPLPWGEHQWKSRATGPEAAFALAPLACQAPVALVDQSLAPVWHIQIVDDCMYGY